MLDHQLVGLITRLLAQVGINRDIAAYDLLKCRADIANDTARTHDNPAHNAKMPDNTKTYQFITGRHKTMIHDVFLLWAEYATIESGWQRIRDK